MPGSNTQIRIPEEQMERIEKFRHSLMITPSLSEVIRFLIDKGLDRREALSAQAGGDLKTEEPANGTARGKA
jgi:hypothetical protein